MLIPLILRRVLEIPYVVHGEGMVTKSQSVYGPFALLAQAQVFLDQHRHTTTLYHLERLDVPVLPKPGVDWANWRWAPRPGIEVPTVQWPNAGSTIWVAQANSQQLGQVTYGPFADEEAAGTFLKAICALRGQMAWGRVHELTQISP